MADIDVVPKQQSYTWLWVVLAIIVIALLIWAFAGRTQAAALLRLPSPALAGLSLAHNLGVGI